MPQTHLTSLALAGTVFLAALVTTIADDGKPKGEDKKTKPKIEGKWDFGGTHFKNGRMFQGVDFKYPPLITIASGTAEWEGSLFLFSKAGKGKIKVDESREPYSIELQVGEASYKGIYRYREKSVDILFSELGAAAPTAFGKDGVDPKPNNFTGYSIFLEVARPRKEVKLAWKPFTSKVFLFSASFPGTPVISQRTLTNSQEFHSVAMLIPDSSVFLQVQVRLERNHLDRQKSVEDLARMAERISQDPRYRARKEIDLDGVPGVEIQMAAPTKGTNRREELLKVYRLGRRHYTVSVTGPPGFATPEPAKKAIQTFFDSFKFLNPGELPRGLEESPAKGILLQDTFAVKQNGTLLATHWMNVGPCWEHHGDGLWRIYDKRAKITPRSGQDVVVANAETADVTLTCELLTPIQNDFVMDAGLVVRFADNDHYYLVAIYHDKVRIFKRVPGAFQPLAEAAFAFRPKTTYRMKVTASGKALTVFINGKQVTESTMDDYLTATRFGLRDNSAPNRQPSWGDFKVTVPEK